MRFFDRFFYHPTTTVYTPPEEVERPFESVTFAASDGPRLHGWFFPADGQAKGTVLHLHGNAGNLTAHFSHVTWLPPAGWNVLCFDYRGYGQSEDRMTRAGSLADAHGALDYLLHRPDVDSRRIVALGQSLGGALGIVLTAERAEIRGLIADGAFADYRRIAAWHIRSSLLMTALAWWVPRFGMSDSDNPVDFVGRIAPRPLLIIHGSADTIVPLAMARELYAAAREPKELWVIDEVEHYEAIEQLGPEVHPRLLTFMAQCVGR